MKYQKYQVSLWLVLMVIIAPKAGAQTGEFRVNAGLITGLGSGGTPLKKVASASFSFVKGGFSFGPEVFWAFGPERILGVGAVSRLRIGASGLRPYLVGGLGGNYWRGKNYGTAGLFTGSIGAGVSFVKRRGVEVTFESRVHRNLQNYGGVGNWNFISVVAGVRLGW